jgi:hypothetical protein
MPDDYICLVCGAEAEAADATCPLFDIVCLVPRRPITPARSWTRTRTPTSGKRTTCLALNLYIAEQGTHAPRTPPPSDA